MTAAEKMVPPMDSEHPRQYRWRQRVAFVACSSFLICVIVMPLVLALMFGVFPLLFDGFARSGNVKAQVDAVNASVATVQGAVTSLSSTYVKDRSTDAVDRIKTELIQLNETHCRTPRGPAREIYATRLSELQDHFTALAGHPYQLPACSDL